MKKVFSSSPLLLLLACSGCTHNPQLRPDQEQPIPAKVIQVSSTNSSGTMNFTGVVAAREVADISSQVVAPVAQVQVHAGDKVTRGEILVRLSSVPLQAAVQQSESQLLAAEQQKDAAEAQKKLAEQTYARYSTLNQRHSVTPQEFDQVKAQLDAANAQLKSAAAQAAAAQAAVQQAQATNAYTVIRAPFSGIVTRRLVDPGALASPGVPLLQIEDAKQHEVDIQVNESALNLFHLGEQVQVQVNGKQIVKGPKVVEIVPSGDPAAHTFMVKIGVPPSGKIYSGMTATVLVQATSKQAGQAVAIPLNAVRERGQLDSVLALDSNSVAQIRYITLGQQQGSEVGVISGLAIGDKILAQPRNSYVGHRIEPQS